ncbi:unnamed protein product [Allacma fusca]|uniref:RING-type domain-containing protein n=1 Tax=Allacma fusca TaxID=39272 RepID=A0A8J2PUR7_9HEXA|nr:unnamed protein product [Allacma fusca]
MDIICSICQCSIGSDPPQGSTELADLFENAKTPETNHHEHWEVGSKVVTTPCGHLFHNSCLTQWFVMIGSRRCPLCNFVSPVHKILSTYPCVTQATTSLENVMNSMDTDSSGVTPSVNDFTLPEPAQNAINSSQTELSESGDKLLEMSTSKVLDLKATETNINGIRTMVYHFGPIRNSKFESSTRDSVKSQRLGSASRTWALASNPCSRCNNLARIQTLMTNDMKDLRDLISEQKSEIDSLKLTVECFKPGEEAVSDV